MKASTGQWLIVLSCPFLVMVNVYGFAPRRPVDTAREVEVDTTNWLWFTSIVAQAAWLDSKQWMSAPGSCFTTNNISRSIQDGRIQWAQL